MVQDFKHFAGKDEDLFDVQLPLGARQNSSATNQLQALQIRLTLGQDFVQVVQPLGVAVLINGKHMCAMARGVRDSHSTMKVNVMHGSFQKDQDLRSEFLARLTKHEADW